MTTILEINPLRERTIFLYKLNFNFIRQNKACVSDNEKKKKKSLDHFDEYYLCMTQKRKESDGSCPEDQPRSYRNKTNKGQRKKGKKKRFRI